MIPHAPAWHRSATCADPNIYPRPTNPEDDIFFSEAHADILKARAICYRCPVQLECDMDGKTVKFGVWAGKARHRVRTNRT